MESGDGALSSTGRFLPVRVSSDEFIGRILPLLQSAHLFEESKHSFKYTDVFLIKNSALEKKYTACREKRKDQGYTDEDLKETYGFLLFDDLSKAKSLGKTGVLTGNGTCTTLGDPSKGVYLSMYSDCLDLNRWYHGKTGHIAILRLTPGKVKKVSENYTQSLTDPTVGFDCHVSEQLPSVSSRTSSFLAFERTQYYLYEMLDNGSTACSPSLACPFALVTFSYTDTKETQQQKSKKKKVACPYSPWMGMLQIGSQTFNVGIRSTSGSLTRAKVPTVIKVERAISMINLRKLLPKSIFNTTHNVKGHQEDLDCNIFEIFTSSLEEKEKLTPLLQEIKEQDVALVVFLNNGGYLVLIHVSHFIFNDNDNGLTTNKVLEGVFVFPGSQAIQRVAKNHKMKRSLPADALRVLPLLAYAEGEIEKLNLNTNKDLCETFVQCMQSYATLISPGLPSSPSREVSIFPDQYDVPDAHEHLYSSPEWTDKMWQSLKLYMNNANAFQIPVCKASEICVAGQEGRREDLEDDIYICLSSPEEPSTNLIGSETEDRQKNCLADVECPQSTAQPVKAACQIVSNLQAQAEVSETSNPIVSTEKDNQCIETPELPLTTDEPSEELIVSITSATQTVGEDCLDIIKHDPLSVTATLQTATLASLTEIVQGKMTLNCSDDCKLAPKKDKIPLEQNFESAQSPSLSVAKTLLESDHVMTQDAQKPLETADNKKKKENDNSSQKTTQVSEEAVETCITDEALLKELEICVLKKKSERWGLKPVISNCGRIFIPFGSVDDNQIKSLQGKQKHKKDIKHPEEQCLNTLNEISNESETTQRTGYDKWTISPHEEANSEKSINNIDSDKSLSTMETECNLEDHKENHIEDVPVAGKPDGETMLKRLKFHFLKKRNALKIGINIKDDLENSPIPKRTKRDLTSETGENSTLATETDIDISLPSVDPIFAQALGLTPKDTPDINLPPGSDLPKEKDLVVAKECTGKQQRQSSPKALGPRFKMLKKNQNISTEQVKKKWWLHFQTPTCYADKLYEGFSRDISVRKTVKEKTGTSSEALNLLADLALSANKEQVSSHPIQACLQEFSSSLKKCEITKDVPSPEQLSVLHALLRHAASKTNQPQETPSPDSFGGSELVDLICQEHAYSLPSSPSLLLALPAPFQVSPINGSSRLLDSQKQSDGIQTMPSIFNPAEQAECDQSDPEDPKRSWYTRKFCLFRTIVNKETSVQVTRHWEGLYDFNLDSRFTVDPKDKAIVRALHGPWDLSCHDTNEEVQLIVHMWIGLFYSRSTDRFFHLDSDVALASSEEVIDATDVSNAKEQEQKVTEKDLSTPFSNEKTPEESVSETALRCSAAEEHEPEILDLSKPRYCDMDKELALNLSQRPSNVKNLTQSSERNEETQALEFPQALQAPLPFQWYWNPIQTAGNPTPLKYVGVPVNENCGNSSELNRQLFIPVWGEIPNTRIVTNYVPRPVLPVDPQRENPPVHFPKSPEFLIRKRHAPKRNPKHVYLSPIPRRKDTREKDIQQVKENLPNLNKSADLISAKGDVDTMKTKHLLEIKNKYLEKLASINQDISFSTPQEDKDAKNCDILKKLLQKDTSKQGQSSECEILPSQHRLIHANSSLENSLRNENVVQSVVQHVFAFPKASSTSIVTETTCFENRKEPQSFSIVGLAPVVQSGNDKCHSSEDSTSVSSVKEKEEPAGHCVATGCQPEFENQDSNIRKQSILDENTLDCSASEDKSMKTVEAPLANKANNINQCSNVEAENSYRSVSTPHIGMSTSIQDMFKEDTSNEMNKEKGVEDMEIASSHSSPAHIEVTTPLPTSTESISHDQPSNHVEMPVAESEIKSTFEASDDEADDRCPTPTIDEQPYVYSSQPCGNHLNAHSQCSGEKPAENSFTPVLDETPAKAAPQTVTAEATAKVGPQSDVELRTLRTLRCLDEFLSTLQNKSHPLFFNNKCTLNTSVTSNKKSPAIVYDFRDIELPSSISHSRSTESTQPFSLSSSNNVLRNVTQPKENRQTFLLCAPDIKTNVSSESIYSTEKPEAVRSDVEQPTSYKSSVQCADMTKTPSAMHQDQTQMSNSSGFNSKFKPIKFCIKRTKQGSFVCSGSVFDAHHPKEKCNIAQPVHQDVRTFQSTEAESSTLATQIRPVNSTHMHETDHETDSSNKASSVKNIPTDEDILKCTTSLVESKTNKITDNTLGNAGSLSCTVTNTKRKESSFLEKVSQRCLQDDSTQSSMDQECLIFFDKMNHLLKRQNQCLQIHCDQSNLLSSSPIIVQFSHLEDQDDDFEDTEIPISVLDQKISVDMSDRGHVTDVPQQSSSKSLQDRDLGQPAISALTAECARLYKNIMNKICSENKNASLFKDLHKPHSGDSMTDSCNYFDFCSQMKREMDDSFRNRLNLVVKKSCKTKNRFFLLVTSDDLFFNETRKYLEAEGHVSVQPSDFFLKESSLSPLLVIIRNEDVAENIFKVPHLLQLRTSRLVQFAGIDEPDDVVNLTYQEIFIKGGFVMFDRAAVDSLSSGDMRKISEILQKLIQTGKWKWLLHYRDSRRFKENARLCPDAMEKADMLNKCKEDGLLDILPYHECDLMSRDEPNYLQCLCHQQVQNISARYPVFVSDSATNEGFEKSGIVTMTVNSFLMESLCKIISNAT